MKSKKPFKTTKKDKDWQQKIEKRVQTEKVELGHPKGIERFDHVLKNAKRKPDQ